MGLKKGAVTFSRYELTGGTGESGEGFLLERLRRYAFDEVWRTADERLIGWTDFDTPLDRDFASCDHGKYLLFSLRIDQKRVPPSLLRLRIMEEERRKLAESGQKRLYREQREAIREAVRLELLAKCLPTPSSFEVCWSVSDKRVLFCSLSDKVVGEFQELFRESFGLSIAPCLPWGGAETADAKGMGREFLTWLWFKSEERGGTVEIPGLGDCGVSFVKRIVLESGEGQYAESVVCQGMNADLREAKEALRQGKKITAARLRLACDREEWEFTFKADRFHFQSLKTIDCDPEGDPEDREGRLLERIYLIEKAAEIMDRLGRLFCEVKSTALWEAESERMKRWISA